MYRNAVDSAARSDITAAVAAHHELGRDYDDAVAESLVDRIGAEIDKRVDARLRTGSSGSRSPAEFSQSGRSEAMWTGAAIGVTIGAAITGFVVLIARHGSSAIGKAVILAWIILAVAGLGTALVRRYRYLSRERYDARSWDRPRASS
jgi:VIT1/CCC1 family predicted Fe2+/Mn2+ transporter